MALTNKDNEIKGEKQRNESMKQRRLFPTSSTNWKTTDQKKEKRVKDPAYKYQIKVHNEFQ